MKIAHNISALNTLHRLNKNKKAKEISTERLSSGLRINKAADDAAGLAISEKMRAQIRGLDQASRNIQDGLSLIQTAEGGLQEIHEILQRMRELTVQSLNDTLTDHDRSMLDDEFQQLKDEIDSISHGTEFNTIKLLDGSVRYNPASTIILMPQSTIEANGGATYTIADGWINFGPAGAKVKLNTGEQVIDDPANWLFTTLVVYADVTAAGAIALNIHNESGLVIAPNGSPTTFTYNGVTIDVSGVTSPSGASGNMHVGTIVLSAGNNDGVLSTDIPETDNRITFQIGANAGDTMTFGITDMSVRGLSLQSTNIFTRNHAHSALSSIDGAINLVSAERSHLGALQNALEHTLNNVTNYSINLTAAESRIRDADMAKEMMALTKQYILEQASQAMLAQALRQPQGILQLIS